MEFLQYHESHNLTWLISVVGGTDLSFLSYIASDLNFKLDQPSNSLFGETTRDKLYNSLFFVGPHLERFMFVGMAKCLDSLLGVMLVMPLQAVAAILSYVRRSPTNPLHAFHVIIFAVWACSCVAMAQVKVRDFTACSYCVLAHYVSRRRMRSIYESSWMWAALPSSRSHF